MGSKYVCRTYPIRDASLEQGSRGYLRWDVVNRVPALPPLSLTPKDRPRVLHQTREHVVDGHEILNNDHVVVKNHLSRRSQINNGTRSW